MTNSNELVGYTSLVLKAESRVKGSVAAVQDMLYVTPSHRGVGMGTQFMIYCDSALKKLGVSTVWRHTRPPLDIGAIYERMGYVFVEKAYARRL